MPIYIYYKVVLWICLDLSFLWQLQIFISLNIFRNRDMCIYHYQTLSYLKRRLVNTVYNGHPWDLKKWPWFKRWLLFTGRSYQIAFNFGKLGIRLVEVDRWSLTKVWLYRQLKKSLKTKTTTKSTDPILLGIWFETVKNQLF
jgi:hypothetical protein